VGLPDANFGSAYESQGGKHDTLLCESSSRCVYLHYPPFPEVGSRRHDQDLRKGRLFIYRLLPIGGRGSGARGPGIALFRAFGPIRAAFVMWMLGGVPMTSNMMHVVALHEYTSAFS